MEDSVPCRLWYNRIVIPGICPHNTHTIAWSLLLYVGYHLLEACRISKICLWLALWSVALFDFTLLVYDRLIEFKFGESFYLFSIMFDTIQDKLTFLFNKTDMNKSLVGPWHY